MFQNKEKRIKVAEDHPRICAMEDAGQRQTTASRFIILVHLGRNTALVKALDKNSISSPVEIFHAWKNTVYIF